MAELKAKQEARAAAAAAAEEDEQVEVDRFEESKPDGVGNGEVIEPGSPITPIVKNDKDG